MNTFENTLRDLKKTVPTYFDYSSRYSSKRIRFLQRYQKNDYFIELVNNDLKTSDFYIFNQLYLDNPNFIKYPSRDDYYSMRFSFRDLNNQEICVISPNIYSDDIFELFNCLNSKILIRFLEVVGQPYTTGRGHNFSASDYRTISGGIINDKTKMLLIIEPGEEFLKEVKNISLEILQN